MAVVDLPGGGSARTFGAGSSAQSHRLAREGFSLRVGTDSREPVFVEPTFSLRTDDAQFVASTGEIGYAPTFGKRHLFATLRQKQVSLQTRAQVAFTPDLSLQAFVQPLFSANDFDPYKQLRRPESFDFIRFRDERAVSTPDGVACRNGRTCLGF